MTLWNGVREEWTKVKTECVCLCVCVSVCVYCKDKYRYLFTTFIVYIGVIYRYNELWVWIKWDAATCRTAHNGHHGKSVIQICGKPDSFVISVSISLPWGVGATMCKVQPTRFLLNLVNRATFAGLWRVLLPHRLESDFWPSNGLRLYTIHAHLINVYTSHGSQNDERRL